MFPADLLKVLGRYLRGSPLAPRRAGLGPHQGTNADVGADDIVSRQTERRKVPAKQVHQVLDVRRLDRRLLRLPGGGAIGRPDDHNAGPEVGTRDHEGDSTVLGVVHDEGAG